VDEVTESLEQWLEEWYAAAYRTACLVLRDPIAAEDAVQEAFLRVWRFRSSIPAGDGRKAWLYRVVVNACMSRGRSEGRHRSRAAELDLSPELASTAPQPDELAEQSELATLVGLALADLPENLRVPLVLRFYAGLSEREIATAIQRRPGTVKSRLHAGRRRLAADPRLAGWVAQLEGAAQ
jgi:RNA polymerase sigma-70 factor, ECF subfamily